MTSLPKRGDRVRVTWAHQHSSLKAGSEVVLSSHGYAVDPANELYRPTPPHDCVSFMYADGHRERGSHAVKVEILERAAQSLPDHVYAGNDRDDWCVNCGRSSRDIPEGEKCGAQPRQTVHPEFARGMRMAVEIAERISERRDWTYPPEWVARIDELKEAVEKELADG
jgi:hypothetical protein